MKLIAFGVLVAIVLPCISAAQVSTETPSKKDFFRKAAEEKIKAEAGEARKIFEKAVVPDEAKRAEALNGLNLILYNKGYNYYRCLMDNDHDGQKAEECAKARNGQMLISTRLLGDYAQAVAPRSSYCEMQARLFEAEIEFPPFSFLGEGHHLLDFSRLNDCLRR